MRIAVLMQGIPDPNERITVMEETVVAPRWILGPYDENALEVALSVCDRLPDTVVTVVGAGEPVPEELLREALAAGAHEAWWLPQNVLACSPARLAEALAQGVAELQADVVLGGIQSGSWDTGVVPALVAGILRRPFLPHLHAVEAISPDGSHCQVRCEWEGQPMAVALAVPWVASVTSSGRNALRYPSMRNRLLAKRKAIREWVPEGWPGGNTRFQLRPLMGERRAGERVEGADDVEKGARLYALLKERRWI